MKKLFILLLMCCLYTTTFYASHSSNMVEVFFHLPSKDVLSRYYLKTAKLSDMREQLATEWKISPNALRFSFAGHVIHDDDIVASYNADTNNPILITYLGEPIGSYMPFLVFEIKFATNRDRMSLYMFHDDKVIDIKRRIQAITGINVADQTLSQATVVSKVSVLERNTVQILELDDTRTLASFGGNTRVIFSRKDVPSYAMRNHVEPMTPSSAVPSPAGS